MKSKYTVEQIDLLKQNYGKLSYIELAKLLNVPKASVTSLIQKHIEKRYKRGTNPLSYRRKRIFHVSDNIFDTPNELNCYWAGMMAADGNITQCQKCFSLSLQEKDKYHIEQFASFLKYTGTIKQYTSKYEYKGVISDKTGYSIQVTSPAIVSDLNKYFNIIPAKSLVLQPPNLSDKRLIDCFIIGYIDGDGSIGLDKGKRQKALRLSLLGTMEMMEWIEHRFSEILGSKIDCIYDKVKDSKSNSCVIIITDKRARALVTHFMQYNVPFLERKWNSEIKNHCLNYKKFRNTDKYQLIIDLLKTGLTIPQIASKLSVSYQAVGWYLKQDLFKELIQKSA